MKLGPFQIMNLRSCKDFIRKVLLLTNDSVRNFAEASRLQVSNVRPFLHSKAPYTEFTLATRKFKRRGAFARFKKQIWCMDLAYVDRLAEKNKGVKYLLVRQDLFDRTVKAKGMKTNHSQETVKAFSAMIT